MTLGRWLKSGLGVAGRAVAALGMHKLIALGYGPAGVALYAHFQNLMMLVMAMPNDGVNRGLTQQEAQNPPGLPRNKSLYGAALQLILLNCLLVTAVLFWQGEGLSEQFGLVDGWWWLAGICLLLPLWLVYLAQMALLLGRQQQTLHAKITVAHAAVHLALVAAAVWLKASLPVLLLTVLGGQSVGLLFTMWAMRRTGGFFYAIPWRLQGEATKLLGKFAGLAVIIAFFGRGTEFFVRQWVINTVGLQPVGLWQAVVKLSDAYVNPLTTLISLVFFPAIAAVMNEPAQVKQELRKAITWVFPPLLLLMGMLYLLREQALVLLNSQEFLPAAGWVGWQVGTDVFKLLAYFLATIWVARARLLTMFLLEAGSATVYLLLVNFLLPIHGIEGLFMANLIRYVLYFTALALLFVQFVKRR